MIAALRRGPGWAAFLWVALAAAGAAAAPPAPVPLEVYGRLPHLEDFCVSPDGTRVAFVTTTGDERYVAAKALADGKTLALLKAGDTKLRHIEWADNRHLLVWISETTVPYGLMGMESEWHQLLVYDVESHHNAVVPDPHRLRDSNFMNAAWGSPVARSIDGHTVLFVPSYYVTDRVLPGIARIDLDSGVQGVVAKGGADTDGWLIDANGKVVADESHNGATGDWRIRIRRDGELAPALAGRSSLDAPRMLGFGPTEDTLLLEALEGHEPVWRLLSLKDGSLGAPMPDAQGLTDTIENPLTHRMIGGVSAGDDLHHVFFDPAMQRTWDSIVHAFAGARVRYISASNDFRKVVVLVEGPEFGFLYELVDMTTLRADVLGDVYDGVVKPHEVRTLTYAAADGVQIPAYLTLPRGRAASALPLVVLPHGGPAKRDTADFDWWSQALAEQGYAVLRPNFRGSAVDQAFMESGYGQWGRKMQTDLSDGVSQLVKDGLVDPARVCIVGASYGGYAALAGATLDTGVYRCAVSVAGISDIKSMLEWVDEKHRGNKNAAQRYWDRFMGLAGPDDPALAAISPIRHVDAVRIPILLIHGKDDTVVPYDQSDDMYDALRHAHKQVELVKLKEEDHWLSRSATRLQMLQATVRFLRANNPPD